MMIVLGRQDELGLFDFVFSYDTQISLAKTGTPKPD